MPFCSLQNVLDSFFLFLSLFSFLLSPFSILLSLLPFLVILLSVFFSHSFLFNPFSPSSPAMFLLIIP